MELLQVTVLFLLLSSLCNSENNTDVRATPPMLPSVVSSTIASATMLSTVPSPNTVTTSTSPKGATSSGLSNSSLMSTVSSFITVKSEGATANGVLKNEPTTTNTAVPNPPHATAASTSQSFQHETENQSSIKTTKITGNTPQPDTSPSRASTLPSISTISTESILQSQGTEGGKNASSASTSPSYSSIILPVVIALIVITLSVFALVGLYRMCWKTDPGTPENGNDQPQSDKESVKLLTVKTISHESGEHSAHGKTKN
ncbi:endomucin [Microcebus murinus]|uniref:Endomucin n=1 Tax=Microcebus murinus TaxID=30608 RepID=A0A8C5XIG8_MICMU|nr:endomucin [Microcebus murinus]